MYSIRKAHLGDIDFLMTQFELSDDAYPAHHSLLADPEELKAKLIHTIENHVVLIGMKYLRPIGYIVGFHTPHLYNSKLSQLSELLWWVIPEYRSSKIGSMLLKEFTKIGKGLGCKWIMLNLNKDTKIKPSSLSRYGYKPADRTYLMEVM